MPAPEGAWIVQQDLGKSTGFGLCVGVKRDFGSTFALPGIEIRCECQRDDRSVGAYGFTNAVKERFWPVRGWQGHRLRRAPDENSIVLAKTQIEQIGGNSASRF